MITDLDTIRNLGERNRDVNYRFRSFLKSKDEDRLDRTVKDLFQFYSSRIDCTKCGNCCTLLKPIIENSDIKTLASITNKSIQEFKKDMVIRVLAEAKGKKSRAAEMLNLPRSNFSRLLKSLDV